MKTQQNLYKNNKICITENLHRFNDENAAVFDSNRLNERRAYMH